MIKHCLSCNSGEISQHTCLRRSRPDGICPVADEAPELWEENDIAADIFQLALSTAEVVDGKDKIIFHVKFKEVESLINMLGARGEDGSSLLMKIMKLQETYNALRPMKPLKVRKGR